VNISHLAPIALGPRQAVRAPGARPAHRTMSAHRHSDRPHREGLVGREGRPSRAVHSDRGSPRDRAGL